MSQNETNKVENCLVLLGASNLTLALPHIVSTAPSLFGLRVKLMGAMGFGRSYGKNSNFFSKKFSGILQTKIWNAAAVHHGQRPKAIVTDIGNDLAYGESVETIVSWVSQSLDRLADLDADIVMSNLPVEVLRRVGKFRFAILRRVFFPSCTLSHSELLARAELLEMAMETLAKSRKIPIFSANSHWYGWDPMHPRRRDAWHLWSMLLASLAGRSEPVPAVRAQLRIRSACWRLVHQVRARSHAHGGDLEQVSTRVGEAFVSLF